MLSTVYIHALPLTQMLLLKNDQEIGIVKYFFTLSTPCSKTFLKEFHLLKTKTRINTTKLKTFVLQRT